MLKYRKIQNKNLLFRLVFEILVNHCFGQSKTKQKLSTFERPSLTMIINVLL